MKRINIKMEHIEVSGILYANNNLSKIFLLKQSPIYIFWDYLYTYIYYITNNSKKFNYTETIKLWLNKLEL